jgi:antitoxin component of MazEF toxin-antitoxin module
MTNLTKALAVKTAEQYVSATNSLSTVQDMIAETFTKHLDGNAKAGKFIVDIDQHIEANYPDNLASWRTALNKITKAINTERGIGEHATKVKDGKLVAAPTRKRAEKVDEKKAHFLKMAAERFNASADVEERAMFKFLIEAAQK